ncbi:hypothetical protein NQ315_002748 [Exocentrus adspersus]|uniref:DDE Tnp4 domain-containing protein n=1 Tax=Exocentrus adspersus TaxID=1586481 RepID=A0AAV8VJE3_9CUCU|nr:hypothetical protein NQ315_002748 [Exocentrus adspersus]
MCEDHFDMEKDTINYTKYKMGFSQKILLTDEAIPTKFHRQEDRKRRLSDAESSREMDYNKELCILADRGFKHLEQILHEKGMKTIKATQCKCWCEVIKN